MIAAQEHAAKVAELARTLIRNAYKVFGYDQYVVRASELEALRAAINAESTS